jgi:hypothetical protein
MSKILVTPLVESFAVDHGNNVISTKLDGGASRYRLDKIGVPHTASVKWTLDETAYDYFMAFYRTGIDYGSLSFEVDLLIDSATLTEYTVHLVPGSLKTTYLGDGKFEITAQLEVVVIEANESEDLATIAAGPNG